MAINAAGTVTIRAASGAQVGTVSADRTARAVALSSTRLVIERTATLDLHDPATGAAVKTLTLGSAAAPPTIWASMVFRSRL